MPTLAASRKSLIDEEDDDVLLLGGAPQPQSGAKPAPQVPSPAASPKTTKVPKKGQSSPMKEAPPVPIAENQSRKRSAQGEATAPTGTLAAAPGSAVFTTKGGDGLAKMSMLAFSGPGSDTAGGFSTSAPVPVVQVQVVNNGYGDTPKDAKLQKTEPTPTSAKAAITVDDEGDAMPSEKLKPSVVAATTKPAATPVGAPQPSAASAQAAAPTRTASGSSAKKEAPKGQMKLDSFFAKFACPKK